MAISGVSGTLTHGSSVTITGTSFGTKATATPFKYDDFQSVTTGNQITTSSAPGNTWLTNPSTFEPIASAALLRSGTPFTKNMRCRWQPTGGVGPDTSNVHLVDTFTGKVYIDTWMYCDSSAGLPANIKPIRLHADYDNQGQPNWAFAWTPGDSSDAIACGRDFPSGGNPYNGHEYFGSSPSVTGDVSAVTYFLNRWAHLQICLDTGSGNDIEDGGCTFYIDGVRRYDRFDLDMLSTGFTAWTHFFLGNYARSEDWSGEYRTYWESFYLDKFWARVEIGDNATYSSCAHREVWIPSGTWSSTSVTATVNRGSFASNASVWLFVVDSTNTPSAGFAITLGAGGGPVTLALTGVAATGRAG